MIEKIDKFDKIKVLKGEKMGWHRYTYGNGEEIFFKNLIDKKFFASKCKNCEKLFIPTRIYCEDCFEEINEFVEIKDLPYIYSYTFLFKDLEDNDLKEPEIVVFLKWENVEGGLIHRLKETNFDEVEIGLKCEPVFKEKREGNINDILYFRIKK